MPNHTRFGATMAHIAADSRRCTKIGPKGWKANPSSTRPARLLNTLRVKPQEGHEMPVKLCRGHLSGDQAAIEPTGILDERSRKQSP